MRVHRFVVKFCGISCLVEAIQFLGISCPSKSVPLEGLGDVTVLTSNFRGISWNFVQFLGPKSFH